jgi:hypothetical protein
VAGSDMPITQVAYDTTDYYQVSLTKGESITLVAKGRAALEIDDGNGNALALGAAGAGKVDQEITNFVAPTSATYYIKVTGSGNNTYTLVATTHSTLDLEHNQSPASAQDLTATIGVDGGNGPAGALETLRPGAVTGTATTFDGLHFTDTTCGCSPADNATAVGDGYVVEAVNTAIRISDMQGNALVTEELTTFFQGNVSGGDPQVVFDDVAQRWYFESFTGDFSGLIFAVSQDANPLDGLALVTTFTNFGGGLPDFAKVGYNNDAIVIMADDFVFDEPGFGQVVYIAIDKNQLLNNGTLVDYQYAYNNFSTDFDAEPARMRGDTVAGGPMYLVEEAGFGSGTSVRVIKLTNEFSNNPVFTPVDIPVDPYGEPVPASQPGPYGPIATNSSMIVSVDWRNGILAASQNVSVPDDNFATTRARWYLFNADAAGGKPVTLTDQGTIDQGAGVNEFMPAVALDDSGNLGLSWIESSPTEYMSDYVATHSAGSPPGSNSPAVLVQAGTDPLASPSRAGDYGSVVVDPDNTKVFWASNEYSPPNSFSHLWATSIGSFTALPHDQDWYSLNASAGDTLLLSVSLPITGKGQFKDKVKPSVALYDSTGSILLAGGDGVTWVRYTVPAGGAGTYYAKVYAADASMGEYFLQARGATGDLPDFHVTATNPGSGSVILVPTSVTIDFNQSVLLNSLSAADLTITDSGNVLPATGFQVVNDHEVTFSLPALPQVGYSVDHQVHLLGGSILDISGRPVDDFTTDLLTDNVPPTVIGSTISEGQPLQPGDVTEVLTFNNAMNTSLVNASGFKLTGSIRRGSYSPASFSFDAKGTTLTVQYASLPDDAFTFSLNAAEFQDTAGLPLTPGFSVGFRTDIDLNGPVSFPTPFSPNDLLGSLGYNQSVSNAITGAGDTNTYTLSLNAGETLTVLLSASALQGTVQVTDPNNNVIGSTTAAALGTNALLQTLPVGTTGRYRLTIGDTSGSIGLYTVQVALNATLQNAHYLGGSDSTLATAQDLSGSSIALGGQGADRLAVQGQFDFRTNSQDYYAFHLAAGESATAALKLAAPPTVPYPNESDYSANAPVAVVYGELTGDGYPDMVVADASDIYVRLNNDDGTFGSPMAVASGLADVRDVQVGDVNGDGRLDIVFSEFHGGQVGESVGVLLGNGDGTFSAPVYSSLGDGSAGIALADFNGDGRLDVALCASLSNQVLIATGNGDGRFALAQSYGTGAYPWRVGAGDLNNDTHTDLVVANRDGGLNDTGNLTVLLNNGDGTFGAPTSILTAPDNTYGVVLGDFNHDGNLDIASTNFNSGTVSVELGKGDGTFGAADTFPAGRKTYAIAAGDINSDGKLSLAVTSIEDGDVAIFRGNGDGTFGSPKTISTLALPMTVAFIDLAGEGQLDLSVAGGPHIAVYVNALNHAHVAIVDGNGNVPATGTTGATNVDEAIANFSAPADGTYYARISGTGSGRDYTLTVNRGSTFNLDPNTEQSQAQDINSTTGVLGALVQPNGVKTGTVFDGLHFTDTSCGCLPPDNALALGDGFVVEAVNTAIRISDVAGTIYSTEELSSFFWSLGQGAGGDPQVIYDDVANRWIVEDFTSSFSGLEFAVSVDANPLDGFTNFQYVDLGLPDFAKVGYNADYLFIDYDEYSSGSVQSLVIDKVSYYSGGFNYQVYNLGPFGNQFDVFPARMHGAAPGDPEYLGK